MEKFDREALEALPKKVLIDIILALQEQVELLELRVAELERKLAQNSNNSSRPPSSDPPDNPAPKKQTKKSARKPGAQPGHQPHWRENVPEDQVAHIIRHRPTRCHVCGRHLVGDDPNPVRHQGIDLPPIVPVVTEHQIHALTCACGAVTRADTPPECLESPFGPGLVAMAATLTGTCHLSKRNALDFLNNVLNVPMSLGGLSNCEAQVTRALAKPVAELHAYIQTCEVAHADETSFGLGHRRKGWLWVMAVPMAMVFVLARSRAREAARKLVGEFRGVLVTDRYGAYNGVVERRQACWAHLGRDFQALSERPGLAGRVGGYLVEERRKMFKQWHRFRDGIISRNELVRRLSPIRRAIHDWLWCGANDPTSCARGVFAELLKSEPMLWVFVEVEGVEPTNNEAERCIRGSVLWRKGSFGVWSERGGHYVERMLTVTGTCRKQRRQVYGYLREAITASRAGIAAPSLLPVS